MLLSASPPAATRWRLWRCSLLHALLASIICAASSRGVELWRSSRRSRRAVWSCCATGDAGRIGALVDIVDAFETGAKYALGVGAAAATVGIVIGVVTLTGVGFKLSYIVTGGAGDRRRASAVLPAGWSTMQALTLFAALVMTALVCILMGCGIPTTANYIIMVTVAAPTLVQTGGRSRWSRTSSSSTTACWRTSRRRWRSPLMPPPAWPAADPFKTGNTAFRLGLAKALVPFVFVFSPAMLIMTKNFSWAEFIETTAGCLVGIVMLELRSTGYGLVRMASWARLLLFVASILVISPSRAATLLGLLLAVPVLGHQIFLQRSGRG